MQLFMDRNKEMTRALFLQKMASLPLILPNQRQPFWKTLGNPEEENEHLEINLNK